MKQTQEERHVLIINGERGRQAIALEAAAYSVGRDLTNAIVLDFETVSRQHAILLRVPVPGTNQYRFRLVDGNADGKPSTNGTFINGKRCVSEQLNHGDTILFGRKVKAAYLTVAMAENEFSSYLESIAYQSIKSQSLNSKETLVGSEFGDQMAQHLHKRTKDIELQPLAVGVVRNSEPGSALIGEPTANNIPNKTQDENATSKATKATVHEEGPDPTPKQAWASIIAAVVVVVALGTGIGLWLGQSQPTQPNSVETPANSTSQPK